MSDGTNVFDIGKLADPITKLVESLSSGAGVLYEPRRIRAKARAEADALVIQAEGELRAESVRMRAQERISRLDEKRQHNIEAIIDNAADDLAAARVSNTPVDPDWTQHFINNCQDVSSEDMQKLWGRILAGEVESPGRFSKRLLEFMKIVGRREATLINEYFRYVWRLQGPPVRFVLFTDELVWMNASVRGIEGLGDPTQRSFISYWLRSQMVNLGIATMDLTIRPLDADLLVVDYQGQSFQSDGMFSEFSVDLLSDLGAELFGISSPEPANAYREACLGQYSLVMVEPEIGAEG